ncbi:siphovirus Gp157 family protein [Staphylococcus sp. HMSC056D08]|uniref:siphovirus Gp157 family protein n=1 Tax=Staphylococcus sp. HMSC056D08 TaxID=1739455 RepID=UPI0008A89970|nr:siphovirus Gp157 family protein [Staphylococcus sp. HMSC056D08]OHR51890.1 siphovirus superfamily [Staphylococcus sp. HMSC056D08]
MANLFNLNQDYKELLDLMEQGIEPEVLKDTMESIEASIDVKVDNTIGLIRSVEGDIETVDKEIKRLQTVKKQKQTFIHTLKTLLQDMLEYRQLQNYRTTTNYIYKRRNAPSVFITNEKLIDKSYFIEQAPKLDKKALKEDIQNGADVPGAELHESESLVIK